MNAVIDPSRLPLEVRPLVQRALRGEGLEEAIDAIEAHFAEGGARTPDLLLALATLTYEDAARVVLSRLQEASREALALVDEALAGQTIAGEPAEELWAQRALFARTLREERARERRLRDLAVRGEPSPMELVALAEAILRRGEDDQLAADLMARAAAESDVEEIERDEGVRVYA